MNDFYWNGVPYTPVTDSITKLSDRFAFLVSDREEWFLKYCAQKYFPSHIEEYVLLKPQYVARWITNNGYSIGKHANGKIEFIRGSVVLETLKELP